MSLSVLQSRLTLVVPLHFLVLVVIRCFEPTKTVIVQPHLAGPMRAGNRSNEDQRCTCHYQQRLPTSHSLSSPLSLPEVSRPKPASIHGRPVPPTAPLRRPFARRRKISRRSSAASEHRITQRRTQPKPSLRQACRELSSALSVVEFASVDHVWSASHQTSNTSGFWRILAKIRQNPPKSAWDVHHGT